MIDYYSYLDHTILKPEAEFSDVQEICKETIEYGCASACIAPSFVKQARNVFPRLNITTVVGFPLGYNTTTSKLFETDAVIADGANEIDMVINIGKLKDKNYEYIEREIKDIKTLVGDFNILKVIIETALLSEKEKIEMCKIVSNSGADFIKTSTGFAKSGATFDDIKLFKKHIDPKVRIKAAGVISSLKDIETFVELGCERLGTSKGVQILSNK